MTDPAVSVPPPERPDAPTPQTSPEPGTVFREYSPAEDLSHPLGRHLLHDPRSRNWDARQLLPRGEAKMPTATRVWPRHTGVWDQGSLGACTAYAALTVLSCEPFYARAAARAKAKYWAAVSGSRLVNGVWQFVAPVDPVAQYQYETVIDNSEVPGSYPPTDTGSTGLWSMRTLQAYALIDNYYHAFDLTTALDLVATQGPVSIGIAWYDSMFQPDSCGEVTISPDAQVAGGHQLPIVGVHPAAQRVELPNSWGDQWGVGGRCFMSYDTLGRLLGEDGDVTIPVMN